MNLEKTNKWFRSSKSQGWQTRVNKVFLKGIGTAWEAVSVIYRSFRDQKLKQENIINTKKREKEKKQGEKKTGNRQMETIWSVERHHFTFCFFPFFFLFFFSTQAVRAAAKPTRALSSLNEQSGNEPKTQTQARELLCPFAALHGLHHLKSRQMILFLVTFNKNLRERRTWLKKLLSLILIPWVFSTLQDVQKHKYT